MTGIAPARIASTPSEDVVSTVPPHADGAFGGTRTHILFRAGDFKFPAYAIPPRRQIGADGGNRTLTIFSH